MSAVDPVKGDTIRWSERRNGRRQSYVGTVQTAHPDRWLVMVGPGRLHNLTRAIWAGQLSDFDVKELNR